MSWYVGRKVLRSHRKYQAAFFHVHIKRMTTYHDESFRMNIHSNLVNHLINLDHSETINCSKKSYNLFKKGWQNEN